MNGRIVIYSALARLWGNYNSTKQPGGSLALNGSGKFSSWDEAALRYIKSLGCTHLWLIGVLEHATAESYPGIDADPEELVKGIAGSPYAVRDYYDVAPELAEVVEHRMEEFESLVQRVHRAGMRLMIDFIPNHVARSYHSDVAPPDICDLGAADDTSSAFSRDNNFYYILEQELQLPDGGTYREYPAKATGNDCFTAYPSRGDWYETIKLNYGVDYQGGGHQHFEPIPRTWQQMYSILEYWAAKGVDGFRCDMAEMVPPAFWAWALPRLKERYPLIFLAEIYQSHRYGEYVAAGFDYLYDKVGVYDTLRGIVRAEISADAFDPSRDAVGSLQSRMCYFLENHDEQRFTSPYFAGQHRAIRPALAVAALSGIQPYLHYFAGELGEAGMEAEGYSGLDGRTTIFDYWSLDSLRRLGRDYQGAALEDAERDTLDYHRRILRLASQHQLLAVAPYHGLNYLQGPGYDRHRLLSFVRYTAEGFVLVVANFSEEAQRANLRFDTAVLQLLGCGSRSVYRVVDLLTDQESISCLTTFAPYSLELEGYGVAILMFEPINRNQD
ncbi:MAG: alpha-amylase family glycosyl hydrolase [Porphyromonas sp.]|nr:alpha-amylase family glycosyl hydrolase [Porphyromonas sp.]